MTLWPGPSTRPQPDVEILDSWGHFLPTQLIWADPMHATQPANSTYPDLFLHFDPLTDVNPASDFRFKFDTSKGTPSLIFIFVKDEDLWLKQITPPHIISKWTTHPARKESKPFKIFTPDKTIFCWTMESKPQNLKSPLDGSYADFRDCNLSYLGPTYELWLIEVNQVTWPPSSVHGPVWAKAYSSPAHLSADRAGLCILGPSPSI